MTVIDTLVLVAQATPQSQPASGPTGAAGGLLTWLPLILMMVVFWWILSRGRGKERKKHEEMLSSIKRNDRVQTIGGIIGSVVDVRDTEVVLKVDETSNVKMRFNRSAIKEVIRETSPDGK